MHSSKNDEKSQVYNIEEQGTDQSKGSVIQEAVDDSNAKEIASQVSYYSQFQDRPFRDGYQRGNASMSDISQTSNIVNRVVRDIFTISPQSSELPMVTPAKARLSPASKREESKLERDQMQFDQSLVNSSRSNANIEMTMCSTSQCPCSQHRGTDKSSFKTCEHMQLKDKEDVQSYYSALSWNFNTSTVANDNSKDTSSNLTSTDPFQIAVYNPSDASKAKLRRTLSGRVSEGNEATNITISGVFCNKCSNYNEHVKYCISSQHGKFVPPLTVRYLSKHLNEKLILTLPQGNVHVSYKDLLMHNTVILNRDDANVCYNLRDIVFRIANNCDIDDTDTMIINCWLRLVELKNHRRKIMSFSSNAILVIFVVIGSLLCVLTIFVTFQVLPALNILSRHS